MPIAVAFSRCLAEDLGYWCLDLMGVTHLNGIKSCPNIWISIYAKWVYPWETNHDLSFSIVVCLCTLWVWIFFICFIPFFIYKPVTVRHYNRISLSSHVAVMAEQNAAAITTKDTGPKREGGRKKNTYSSAHIPPHSVALSATQIMMYLEHCGGHQHVWRLTHLNCKIGRACWPTSFRFGRISSVFSHPTRSEVTPSPPLISQ